MRFRNLITIVSILSILSFGVISCSSNKQPITPENTVPIIPEATLNPDSSGHTVLAEYEVLIDPASETVSIEPLMRGVNYHLPLSNYFNVVSITGYGFTPNFWANIRLAHPFPGSGIDAYDARVIAMLPANPGVSMNYPWFDLTANNSVVMNPDGYTKLHDNPSIAGTANPFMAYFRSEPNRVWSSTGLTEETIKWDMDLSGFGGPLQYRLVVDVSTNWPSAPQPIVDNCVEPVEIIMTRLDPVYTSSTGFQTEFTIIDWQGRSDISGCGALAPDLHEWAEDGDFNGVGPSPEILYFECYIPNELSPPPGDYPLLITAKDSTTNVSYYNEFTFTMLPDPFSFTDITPEYLNFTPNDMFSSPGEDVAFIAAGQDGLHIFGIDDPEDIYWRSMCNVTGGAFKVTYENNFVYLKKSWSDLGIYDVSDVMNPVWVATLSDAAGIDLEVSDGYLYALKTSSLLDIYDVSTPSSPQLVHSIELDGANEITIIGDYAYVACESDTGFKIIDISIPASASIVNTSDNPRANCSRMCVSGITAYLVSHDTNIDDYVLRSFSLANPGNPVELDEMEIPFDANGEKYSDIETVDGFVYIISDMTSYSYPNAIVIFDAYDPTNLSLVESRPLLNHPVEICLHTNEYFYLAEADGGISSFDISDASGIYRLDQISNLDNSQNAAHQLGDDYMYVARKGSESCCVLIEPPENARVVAGNQTSHPIWDFEVAAPGYLWAGCKTSGLQAFSAIPPDNFNLYSSVPDTSGAADIETRGDYIYVAAYDNYTDYYFYVVDATSVAGASVLDSIELSGVPDYISIGENYALVSMWNTNVTVIDITNPADIFIAATINLDHPHQCDIVGDYAYVASGSQGLRVYDMTDYTTPDYVTSLDFSFYVYLVKAFDNDHLIVCDSNATMHTVDISTSESPVLIDSYFKTGCDDLGIEVIGNTLFRMGESGIYIYEKNL